MLQVLFLLHTLSLSSISLCAHVIYEYYSCSSRLISPPLSLFDPGHLFITRDLHTPDRLYLKHQTHRSSISQLCLGFSLVAPHSPGDSFGSQAFMTRSSHNAQLLLSSSIVSTWWGQVWMRIGWNGSCGRGCVISPGYPL